MAAHSKHDLRSPARGGTRGLGSLFGRTLPLLAACLLAASVPAAGAETPGKGVPATVAGRLLVIQADDSEAHRAELMYFVEDRRSQRRTRIQFDDPPEGLRHGMEVSVRGLDREGTLYAAADGATPTGGDAASMDAVSGEQQVLVMLADFSDAPVHCTVDQVARTVFGSQADGSVDALYREMSSGALSLAGQVAGPYAIGYTSGSACDVNAWAAAADRAALEQGIDPDTFQRRVYVLPQQNSCGWTGLASIGGDPSYAWVLRCDQAAVYAHELGHNLGMNHASTEAMEYGDTTDPMGATSGGLRQLNAPHYEQMGWRQGKVQAVAAAGTYEMAPLSLPPGEASAPQVLKLAKPDTGDSYYLSYRQPVGFDSSLYRSTFDQLFIHRYAGKGGRTTLLRGLSVGETFTDEGNGITVTHVAHTPDLMTVQVGLGTSCAPMAPTLAVTPARQSGAAGAGFQYQVSLRNNDSPSCAASGFRLSANAPGGWTAGATPDYLSLAPGQSASAVLTIDSSMTAAAGTYRTTLNATDLATPRHDAAATVEAVIESPACARSAPDVRLTPSEQAGDPGDALAYRVTVQNLDGSSCATSAFEVAASLPSGWTASLSARSLTLPPGSAGTVDAWVTSLHLLPRGRHDFRVSATDPLDGQHAANTTGTYVVNEPTNGGGADSEAPTVPSGLAASANFKQVNLSWAASSDNVAVAGYRVYRDGVQVGDTPYASFSDSTGAEGVVYAYSVDAYDAAGNASRPSQPVSAGKAKAKAKGGGSSTGGGKGRNK